MMPFTLMFGSYTFPNQTFEVKGLPLENNLSPVNIPRAHGAIILTPYLKERYFRIQGVIHNQDKADTLAQVLAMQAALLSGEKSLQYSADRCIDCFVQKIDPQYADGLNPYVADMGIDMVAQVPFLYSAGVSYSVVETASGITHQFSVYSGGNVFAEPKISFFASGAAITNNLFLQNLSNGQQLRWRGTLVAGNTMILDSKDMSVKIGAIDGISNFEGDFIILGVGTNLFQYVGDNCQITVEHKWRWYA